VILYIYTLSVYSKAVFLRTFPAVYGELLKIFTVREVAGFVRETLGSLPATARAECPLEAVKLHCIAKTVESQLYTNTGRNARTHTHTIFILHNTQKQTFGGYVRTHTQPHISHTHDYAQLLVITYLHRRTCQLIVVNDNYILTQIAVVTFY
jgi:hypothetical protein